jgi:hypothetical protein
MGQPSVIFSTKIRNAYYSGFRTRFPSIVGSVVKEWGPGDDQEGTCVKRIVQE